MVCARGLYYRLSPFAVLFWNEYGKISDLEFRNAFCNDDQVLSSFLTPPGLWSKQNTWSKKGMKQPRELPKEDFEDLASIENTDVFQQENSDSRKV